ncbi:NnrU family protein [Sphingomonas sp. 1P06PA]|uniref:NnrU family protein n=1 Tax=Sphingomonas sp. 1P06PA TaxID=554121 RepID=UPI0039A617A0
MSVLAWLAAATILFVGGHFLLSHPLRATLVGRMGEGPFLWLYSLVAFVGLGGMIWAGRAAPDGPLLWIAPPGAWDLATIVMLLAAILLAGSLVGNPALPDPKGARAIPAEARGVYAITRHPMMWAFILWAIVHALLWGTAANLILSAGIFTLAFFGARAQDAKKRVLMGDAWRGWEAKTAFWPFAAQISGRSRWRAVVPGMVALGGGIAIWLLATAAHAWMGGPVAGPWRWF